MRLVSLGPTRVETYRKMGISGRIPVVVWVAEFQRSCRGFFFKLVEEGDQTGSNIKHE